MARSTPKVVASPVPPVASDHKATPIATISHRRWRSPNRPNTGAATMYVTRKAGASRPIRNLASGWSFPNNSSRTKGSTADSR